MPVSRSAKSLLFEGLLLVSFIATSAFANPSGGVVQHGDIVIDPQGDTLRIYQNTDRGIIDWNSFSIASGEVTQFIQPSSSSITLNRVTGQTVSRIDGRLIANGRIFLLNPNGVVVGQGGVIDVAGFTASTLDLSDRDFLAGGDFRFAGNSQASVVNLGEISAFEGDVFLVASSVINEGQIRAANGTVGLAAGNDVLIAESGSERIFVKGASGPQKENGVINQGTVEANVAELKSYGGNIYGMAVKNEGRVAATGVTRSGGQIFLSAGGRAPRSGGRVQSTGTLVAKPVAQPDAKPAIQIDAGNGGEVEISGTVDASGDSIGGTIVILGETVDLLSESVILADGANQGGRILIGGGRRGLDPEFMNATDVTVASGAQVSASATESGDGGEVIVFAKRDLVFRGLAAARGGAQSGDGGFVELSGKRSVDVGSLVESVDVRASNGVGGMLLFDPEDIIIMEGRAAGSEGLADPTVIGASPAGDTSATSMSLLYSEDVSAFLADGSLRIETDVNSSGSGNGDITIQTNADLNWNSESNLEIAAFGTFFMKNGASITSRYEGESQGGNVTITGASGVVLGVEGTGGASIFTETGNVSISNDNFFDPFPPLAPSSGIQLFDTEIITGSGDIGIKGWSEVAGEVGLGVYDSRILSDGGDIDLDGRNTFVFPDNYEGPQAEGLEIDIEAPDFFSDTSLPAIGTTDSGTVSLFGQTQSTTEGAIEVEGPVGETLIGNAKGEGSLASVNIVSGGGDLFVNGTIVADQVFFSGLNEISGQSIDLLAIPTANFISISDATTVNVWDTVDLGVFSFSSVNEVVGKGPDSRVVGSDRETYISVLTEIVYDEGEGDSLAFNQGSTPIVLVDSPSAGTVDTGDTVFEIQEYDSPSDGESEGGSWTETTRFSGFREVSGGGGNDVFDIRLDDGAVFTGTLRGGSGSDQFLFGNAEGPLGGREFTIGSIRGSNEDGVPDVDTIDFSYLGAPVTVDFGAENAQWGAAGRVNMIGGMERVVGDLGATTESPNVLRGTSGADQFVITEDNGGVLNKGQFFGFGQLEGAGGPDRFLFTNQANVQEVIGGFGFDTLTLNDTNLIGDQSYTITDNTITRNPTYTFSELEVLQLFFGSGNDTVATTDNGLIQFLNGGGGFDVLDFGGANVVGQNPYTIGGTTIFLSAFEDPASIAIVGNETEELLTQQTQNVPTVGDPNGIGGAVVDQFSNTGNAPTPTVGSLGMGGNAFSAAVAGQAVVIQLDGDQYLLQAPASLDGTFSLPPLEVIEQLKGNLEPADWQELADAIDFEGGTVLVMSDGAYSIDLTQVPPAELLTLLQGNLDVGAASELVNALEMTLVIPVTAQDGALGIVAIPIVVPPNIANLLTQLLAQDSFDELAAALDGP